MGPIFSSLAGSVGCWDTCLLSSTTSSPHVQGCVPLQHHHSVVVIPPFVRSRYVFISIWSNFYVFNIWHRKQSILEDPHCTSVTYIHRSQSLGTTVSLMALDALAALQAIWPGGLRSHVVYQDAAWMARPQPGPSSFSKFPLGTFLITFGPIPICAFTETIMSSAHCVCYRQYESYRALEQKLCVFFLL